MRLAVATIKDVARKAGVSISTVSAVVNGSKPVSSDLVARVQEAIKELDYHPNAMARSLNTRRSNTLAYLTPDISNVGFLRIYKAIEGLARARGYTMLLVNTEGSLEMAHEAVRQVIELHVDGVFVTLSWALAHPDLRLTQLAERGIETVGVSGSWPVDGIDCFLWDEVGAGRQLGRYLKRLGHAPVLCVGPSGGKASSERWGGVREGMASAESDVIVADTANYTAQAGYDAVQRALAEDTAFTAVIAFNDAIATGALAALYDQGLSVPDDLSFVSFGDHHRDFSRPQITSMVFDEGQIATLAASRLMDRVEGLYNGPAERSFLDLHLSIQPSSRKQLRPAASPRRRRD